MVQIDHFRSVPMLIADDKTCQKRVESLFSAVEKLAVFDEPILSDAELEAEIAAAHQALK